MTMNKTLLAVLPLALLLAACSESQPSSTAGDTNAATPAPAAPVVERIEVPKTRFIHAEPAELESCDYGKVMLKWDTSTAEKPPAVVEIYAGNAEETPGLFAAAGATGEKETGPWVRPGSAFSLRDKSTGTELERLVIGGPRCP